jgi:hypothetical protein
VGFFFSEGVLGKGEHQQGTELGSAGRLEPWIVFTEHSSGLVLDIQEAMLVKGMRGRAGENPYSNQTNQ